MKEESIAFSIVMMIVWAVTGMFVAFVFNGGAAGSSEMSDGAWVGLAIYTLIFCVVSNSMHDSFKPDDNLTNQGFGSNTFECDEPLKRDAHSIKISDQKIDYTDKYDVKKVVYIVIPIIAMMLGYMAWKF